MSQNEIIVYQPDSTLSLDVKVENETVWLTQSQMTELFQTTRNNITLHIRNIFKEGELEETAVCKESLLTAADGKKYRTKLYSLDVIISVGYRVKSIRGTQFRIWANNVLKEYLLRGYSINNQLARVESHIERRLADHEMQIRELSGKVDFILRTSLPPQEGILFDGQIFDAYRFVCDLVRRAKTRVVLVDNYVDETVLTLLNKRKENVDALIYTKRIDKGLQLDLKRHNDQYPQIEVKESGNVHDRFLIIDDMLYHIGASIKDLGKKLFAFSKMESSPAVILDRL